MNEVNIKQGFNSIQSSHRMKSSGGRLRKGIDLANCGGERRDEDPILLARWKSQGIEEGVENIMVNGTLFGWV